MFTRLIANRRSSSASLCLVVGSVAAVRRWGSDGRSNFDAAQRSDVAELDRRDRPLGHERLLDSKGLDELAPQLVGDRRQPRRSEHLLAHPRAQSGDRGHKFNLAISGVDGASMLLQAQKAVGLKPTPELVVVQGIDNDMPATPSVTSRSRRRSPGARRARRRLARRPHLRRQPVRQPDEAARR